MGLVEDSWYGGCQAGNNCDPHVFYNRIRLLLTEYAPNVLVEALQNLLLPFQAQMKRLQAMEDHLKG